MGSTAGHKESRLSEAILLEDKSGGTIPEADEIPFPR
jgi:hypothetical protein